MNDYLYSNDEKSISLNSYEFQNNGAAFIVGSIPDTAVPIIDDDTGEFLGFSDEGATNVWKIYDANGDFVALEEAALEKSIDPFDIILIGAAAIKFAQFGFSSIFKGNSRKSGVFFSPKLSTGVIVTLRARLRNVSASKLKFSKKAAKHMKEPGRYVPIHILNLAIKNSKRTVDPQKAPGVYRYEIKMQKFFKRAGKYVREEKL